MGIRQMVRHQTLTLAFYRFDSCIPSYDKSPSIFDRRAFFVRLKDGGQSRLRIKICTGSEKKRLFFGKSG